jgi:hypothetical protein
MNLTISTPVQLVLVATLVGSIVVMLRPDPIEVPASALPQGEPHAGRKAPAQKSGDEADQPWKRAELPEAEAPKAASMETTATTPLPPQPGVTASAEHVPPLPPTSAEPAQHDLVYLGRMVKDDKVLVFLASHGEPVVVREGDVLNGSWLVQSVSSANVTLRQVESGKTRVIAMGDSTDAQSSDVRTVQIGPRFLASDPTQH